MAIPIQNTCRLLGEPLSIAEKTERSHQLSVISYQLSDVSFQFTDYCLLKKRSPLPPSPHSPTSPLPHLPIHNL
ncbi:MAG: hypothetical protein EWV53_06545 [Microcystis panniformis Mp_MB_F_20051200_S9]|uniref:Uncharacterized protein n=1 Tax=Microcystis panniformis Mp_MB_F_20051200_S9 TaxID=2486223 RepID=A0A552Q5G7_9CHRO|nr:MAG: hypothetical protein EWV87_19975 [Microcystis panniformis Mp_GB_SS_20050300_S99]TRV47134.1 MAG: hypothetical protein EWV43_13405 [Microcystis panniformis Mp_MB_F_20080800_S26D]TRV49531.1 MAG: hypothetical protein EWV42_12885 [Microcystis panniformis Mp_GB_SS_20050300_S99D]TRV59698.1 MAG: hypothetical protein EWV69_11260 [Microcystis panniformis Mp_MB_F_20080800_S26]TRV63078.1 MAG: hypothetical protein EWV86_12770 [Microcystis panniformis Mp_MB_F_20051200_S9D]TRV64428.1 MAG: hypothetica